MKKVIILVVFISQFLSIPAQKITCADSLKVFYTNYFTYDVELEDENRLNSLVSLYCTKGFYNAWFEDVYDIGLYDPLTQGSGSTSEDLEFIKKSLSVKREKDYYLVSFKFHGWQGDINMITVYVYVNADGKISHTKRPSDGYMTPGQL